MPSVTKMVRAASVIVGVAADADLLADYSDIGSLAKKNFSLPELIQDLVTTTELYSRLE